MKTKEELLYEGRLCPYCPIEEEYRENKAAFSDGCAGSACDIAYENFLSDEGLAGGAV